MKTSHIYRSFYTCFARFLFGNIFFALFLMISIHAIQAQCIVNAGQDKIIRFDYPEYVQLNAFPNLKNDWKEHRNTTKNTYLDACYVNDTTMVAVGSQGNIVKYSQQKWHEIPTNITTPINAVDFYDDKNGIAVGMNDVILKTTDGGDVWNKVNSETGYLFNNVQYFSAQNIIISGYKLITGQPVRTGFFSSVDGGNNWNLIGEISGTRITSFDFINSTVGFACGNNNAIYKTTDGGANWQKLNTDHVDLSPNYNIIKAASAQVIYAAGNKGAVVKSIDGGENWMPVNPYQIYLKTFNDKKDINTLTAIFESIMCKSEDEILISGYISSERIGIILKSNIGGEFWEEEKVISGIKPRITKMIGNSSGGYLAVGDEGIILTKHPEEKFAWTPATGLNDAHLRNPIAYPGATTTYTVTRTAANCSATDDVTVYVARYNEEVKTIQCGQSVQLDSVPYPTNFNGTVKYKWIPDRGLDSDTVARPVCAVGEDTKYTGMVILNDGNIYRDSVISRAQYVIVKTFNVNAGEDKIAEPGSQLQLNVSHNYTGTDQLSYKWYPADGLDDDTKQNPIATIPESITYTVAVTTASGCVAYDDIEITARVFQPQTFTRTVQLTCGSSVVLDSIKTNYGGTGRLSYRWSPATGLDSDTIASPTCSASTSTTYTVYVTMPDGKQTSSNVILQVVPIKINALTNKSFYCGQQVQLDSVTTNYNGPDKLSYKWTPATGLSNDTIPNPVVNTNETTTYTVTISTAGGCSTSATVTVTKQGIPTPAISGVSVDSQQRNRIQWELPTNDYDSIFIYKETNQLNQYLKIGSVGKNISLFTDTLSQPRVMSNSYKIALLDRCGIETAQSSRHKTMHLAINKGINNSWNLIWEPYIGFEVATYYIYRGTTANQLSLISSLSGANTQFSDFTAPAGDIYYQIEAVKSASSNIKSIHGNIKNQTFVSHSNIAAYQENVGVHNPLDISQDIMLTPNPASTHVEVQSKAFNGEALTLTIYNLQGVALIRTEMRNASQHLDISDLAAGMYFVVLENSQTKGSRKLVVNRNF